MEAEGVMKNEINSRSSVCVLYQFGSEINARSCECVLYHFGSTPLKYAMNNSHTKVAEVLRKAGGRSSPARSMKRNSCEQ